MLQTVVVGGRVEEQIAFANELAAAWSLHPPDFEVVDILNATRLDGPPSMQESWIVHGNEITRQQAQWLAGVASQLIVLYPLPPEEVTPRNTRLYLSLEGGAYRMLRTAYRKHVPVVPLGQDDPEGYDPRNTFLGNQRLAASRIHPSSL